MTERDLLTPPPIIVEDYRSYTADEILRGILEFSESRGWTDPANLGGLLGAIQRWKEGLTVCARCPCVESEHGGEHRLCGNCPLCQGFTPRAEPLSRSPELRHLLNHWHHVRCSSRIAGGPCDCWERREKLIAELAERGGGGN